MKSRRKIKYWVIPPDADAEFVAAMEEVLDIYHRPYDPKNPVICMDEQSIQLTREERRPLLGQDGNTKRIDYEYKRAGTACIFMFCEPLGGWRDISVRRYRTKVDWAKEMARLLDGRFANIPKITLVSDNLNTHTKGAFYEAFEPAKARGYVRRIDFRHTPKHGSWLNIAENELSCMTRQCLKDERIGTIEELEERLRAWGQAINEKQRGVDWHMKIGDARIKLKSVYPKIIY